MVNQVPACLVCHSFTHSIRRGQPSAYLVCHSLILYTQVSQVPTLSVIHSLIIYTGVSQVHTLSVILSLILCTEVSQVPALSSIHSLYTQGSVTCLPCLSWIQCNQGYSTVNHIYPLLKNITDRYKLYSYFVVLILFVAHYASVHLSILQYLKTCKSNIIIKDDIVHR